MSSGNFDVESANLAEGSNEARMGLDEAGVEEVRRIMAIERCGFDQARLIRHNRILAKNGIAPDGKCGVRMLHFCQIPITPSFVHGFRYALGWEGVRCKMRLGLAVGSLQLAVCSYALRLTFRNTP